MMRPAQPESRRQPERDLPSGSARAIKPAALGSRDLTMYRSVGEFAHHVRQRAQAGDLSGALETIRDLVVEIIVRDSSYANVFASAEIDGLCVELGRQNTTLSPTIRDRDQSVFLVTSLARMGGHTRVLLDLAQSDPAPRKLVIITNVLGDQQIDDLDQLFAGTNTKLEIAPSTNLEGRLRWLQHRLGEVRPARTYVLQHHFDPICIAAAQPELSGQLIYIHNCDHSLAIGVHAPAALHVDYTAKAFHNCRDRHGLKTNTFWPLTVDVRNHRRDQAFMVRGGLTTCTSGGFEKFEIPHLIHKIPYLIDYSDAVPLILRSTGGTHIHIGQLSDNMLQAIARKLTDAGISPDGFVSIPFVPDLAAALVDHQVDAYVGSFPRGGGRACVEAMGAGLPLIIHSNYRSIFFSDEAEVYPQALIWRTPDELAAHLRSLTVDVLRHHAAMSRSHFEGYHRPELLAEAIVDTLAGRFPPVPARPNYQPDALQYFLDALAGGFPP
jgi:hypothetical protein